MVSRFRPWQNWHSHCTNLRGKIETFDVNLAIILFLRALESECLPAFIKNREIVVSHRDEITSIKS